MIDTETLWKEYRESPSTANRNRLAEAYYPLCVAIAAKLARSSDMEQDTDDFIAYGVVGLLDAISKYTPGEARFTTYAPFRIRGAILDALRSCHIDGRLARRGERGASVSSFDAMDLEKVDCLARDGMQGRVEIRDLYRSAMSAPGMTPQLRRVAKYRYENRMTLLSIGKKVGLSEGRICQQVKHLDGKFRAFFVRNGIVPPSQKIFTKKEEIA